MCDHPHLKRLSISGPAYADLSRLKEALETLISNSESSVSNPSLAQAQMLLRRGHALRLLPQSFQVSDFTGLEDERLKARYAHAIADMLLCYALWLEVASRPPSVVVSQWTPTPYSALFRWLVLIHPRFNHLHHFERCGDNSCVVEVLGRTFGYLMRHLTLENLQYFLDNPRSLRLVLDLWLNHTRYFPLTAHRAVSMVYNFTSAALLLFVNMDKVEGGQELFVNEMLALSHRSRRRVQRAIAKGMVFLQRLAPSPEENQAWTVQFALARIAAEAPPFFGVVAPKIFIETAVLAARYVVQFPGEEDMRNAARDALQMLQTLCVLSPHTVNLRRAIKAGIFLLLADCERAGAPMYEAQRFGARLATALTQATVLRSFHACHSDLLAPGSTDAFVEERFGCVLRAYRALWPQYLASRQPTGWRLSLPCSNPLVRSFFHSPGVYALTVLPWPPPHTSRTLRLCRCGTRAYCSKECQRMDWQRCDHRATCDHDDEGKPAVERMRLAELSASTNVFFFCRLAQSVIQRNHANIALVLHA